MVVLDIYTLTTHCDLKNLSTFVERTVGNENFGTVMTLNTMTEEEADRFWSKLCQ